MSIVEKAIDKLRDSRQIPVTPLGRTAEPRSATHDPVAPPPESILARLPDAPRHRIDRDALRRDGMLVPEEHDRRKAHEFRRIKWPLLAGALGRGGDRLPAGNLIMVTSALPGDGKTFTSMNLALAIGTERDCSVLLVDADPAKGHLTSALGLKGRRGLTDLVQDASLRWQDVIIETDIPGLRVVTCGTQMSQAPELFASPRMQGLLADFSAAEPNCVVVFDSSPLLATNESQVLARLVGQVLLVVRAIATPKPAVLDAIALVDPSKPTALLFNQAENVLGDSQYYGYYDYGNDKPQDGNAN